MSIPAAARPSPIPKPQSLSSFVDADGRLSPDGVELLAAWRDYMLGNSRIIPCESAFAANVYTLTPRAPACVIEKYCDYDGFAFVAAAASTAAVTAKVVTGGQTLATLKVYKSNGLTQAGNTDIGNGLFYIAFYVDALDTGAGGLVLK
jgi:hypothetical protein